jgi:hypothetical protein
MHDLAQAQPDRAKQLGDIWKQHTEEFGALARKDPPPPQPKGKKGEAPKGAD